MGESLHDMMLRQIGVMYDVDKLEVFDIATDVMNDEEGNVVHVHTVRFLQRRIGPDIGRSGEPANVVPEQRRRTRV